MATERLSMRRTREILRQKLELGRSHREVAASVGLSVGAVGATLVRAAAAGLSWASVQGLTDETLDERLYGAKAVAARPLPDCGYIHVERKKPGVTLELLHLEYLEKHPDGYRYTQFCERYREWLSRRGLIRAWMNSPLMISMKSLFPVLSAARRGNSWRRRISSTACLLAPSLFDERRPAANEAPRKPDGGLGTRRRATGSRRPAAAVCPIRTRTPHR